MKKPSISACPSTGFHARRFQKLAGTIGFLTIIIVFFAGCTEDRKPGDTTPPKEVLLGKPADPAEWPFQYSLVRDQKGWSGEVAYAVEGQTLFLGAIHVVSSEDQKISFTAPFGRPGKALDTGWELSLSKTANGFDGELRPSDPSTGIKPVRLEFVSSPDAAMPSKKLEGDIRIMDDARYRTEKAMLHEIRLARQAWEEESKVAARIAALRSDDSLRKGVRREWVGPAWVRTQLKPEDSQYFERICCVYLGGTTVTDDDLLAISSLGELRELFLHHTEITDAGLAKIGELQRLRVLHLRNTHLSDEILSKLATLKNLEELYLFETKITDAVGKRLREQLPDTKVEW